MSGGHGFLLGVMGGGALEFLEIARLLPLSKKKRRQSTHDLLFWFVRVGFAVFGGVFGYLYVVTSQNPVAFVAAVFGAAWPTIVGRSGELATAFVPTNAK